MRSSRLCLLLLTGLLLLPSIPSCRQESTSTDPTEESSSAIDTEETVDTETPVGTSEPVATTEPPVEEFDVVAFAKTINNKREGELKRPTVENVVIYDPDWNPDWTFSHGPNIVYFKNKFYLTYSSGHKNEDDCGQRVMIASSEDGLTWSKPTVLTDTKQGQWSEMMIQATGLLATEDYLVAFFSAGEYAKDSLRGPNLRPEADGLSYRNGYYIYSEDGVNWSEEVKTPSFILYRPHRLSSGTYIGMGPSLFPYVKEENVLKVSKYGFAAVNVSGIRYHDASITLLTESKLFETADGVIHMCYRTNTGKIWYSRSEDGGKHYTDPCPTSFTNENSMFEFGNLPDGRIYCVSNPTLGSNRTPLVLSISEDGVNFSDQYILRDEPYELKYEGMYKGGIYAYPDAIVVGDYLYVTYSVHKEQIAVSRIALSELAGN